MYAGLDPMVVSGLSKSARGAVNAIGNTVGNAALSEVAKGPLSEVASAEQPKTAEEIEFEKNPIVVKSYRPINPVGGFDPTAISKDLTDLGKSVSAGLPALTELAMDPTLAEPAAEDIVVTGTKAVPKTVVPDVLTAVAPILPQLVTPKVPAPDPALTKKPLGVEDYLGIAGKAVGLLGNLTGGGKGGSGSGGLGTYVPGGAGSGRLNPIFSAQLPAAGGLGNIGATRTASALGDVDWLTYGTRPELKFFDYSTTPANPAPVTSPVPGNPAGPIMAEDKIRHSDEGIPLWMQLGLPNPNAPVTQPGAAGQIMEERDPVTMFEGGALDAASDRPSKRNEFAVNGPGTGRSDDIPAVLSDGEYVIDAETVALLGDGSSKAGAKKLDDLRVKVRKHKGKKLAKGRFSANAKKPEAYLSGGRI
jgi:hypothetical protein